MMHPSPPWNNITHHSPTSRLATRLYKRMASKDKITTKTSITQKDLNDSNVFKYESIDYSLPDGFTLQGYLREHCVVVFAGVQRGGFLKDRHAEEVVPDSPCIDFSGIYKERFETPCFVTIGRDKHSKFSYYYEIDELVEIEGKAIVFRQKGVATLSDENTLNINELRGVYGTLQVSTYESKCDTVVNELTLYRARNGPEPLPFVQFGELIPIPAWIKNLVIDCYHCDRPRIPSC